MEPNDQNSIEARLAALENAHSQLREEFNHFRSFIYTHHFHNRLFEKAFQVMCWGDYIEFGVFEGASMVQAYQAAKRIFDLMDSGHWDNGFADLEKKKVFQDAREKMRFIGFDTFTGMPELNKIDATYEMFEEGSFKTHIDTCRRNLAAGGLSEEKAILVPGRFEDTLNEATAKDLKLSTLSVVHIDCDLYSSALQALEFVTPYLQDGSIIIFDEWYHYKGNPSLGEQRAFHEWKDKNPQLILNEFHKEGPYRNSFIVTTETY
jgi:hypothetical protein